MMFGRGVRGGHSRIAPASAPAVHRQTVCPAIQQQHTAQHGREHSHHLASTSFQATHAHEGTPVPSTLHGAVTTFARHPTTVVILGGIASVLVLRLRTQGAALGAWDAATVAAVATFWVLQEWAIHKYLLHAPFEWVGSKIHVDHHQQPYHHVSIDSLAIVVPFMVVAAGVFYTVLDGDVLWLTATAAYYAMGLSYEWVHFLVHTRYVPRCEECKRVFGPSNTCCLFSQTDRRSGVRCAATI